jgi:hypothetical protein
MAKTMAAKFMRVAFQTEGPLLLMALTIRIRKKMSEM